jgi:hypothetical protein
VSAVSENGRADKQAGVPVQLDTDSVGPDADPGLHRALHPGPGRRSAVPELIQVSAGRGSAASVVPAVPAPRNARIGVPHCAVDRAGLWPAGQLLRHNIEAPTDVVPDAQLDTAEFACPVLLVVVAFALDVRESVEAQHRVVGQACCLASLVRRGVCHAQLR